MFYNITAISYALLRRCINLHPTEPDHFDPKRFLFIVTQILVRLKKNPSANLSEIL